VTGGDALSVRGVAQTLQFRLEGAVSSTGSSGGAGGAGSNEAISQRW
jgi:hypothetical protein